ncbi:hypothetical protein H0H81_012122 [Sphagnurus paluster]|uniref:Uncharacterized protein n=1 Tax=Sphagnurus paluster TaxID=117069 RepID=A0A9P7FNI8_9AGAR|nr:hypothetical protein H0H81_012122 [Sphagnurus paluster]
MTQGVANQELCGSCSAMTEALHRLARALADVQEVPPRWDWGFLSAAVTASITAPLGTIPAFIIGTEAGDAISADIADGSAAMPSNILVENLPAVYIPPELLWYAVIVGQNPGVYQGS